MKNQVLLVLLAVSLQGFLEGQDRPSLTAPVLKAEPETISFTTRITNLAPGSDYRIGVGAPTDIQGGTFEVANGDAVLPMEPAAFKQGYATAYFEMDAIPALGYLFSSTDLPGPEEAIVLKVSVPREEADRLERIFIFVSKQFGPTTWYIMDGAEINNTHW